MCSISMFASNRHKVSIDKNGATFNIEKLSRPRSLLETDSCVKTYQKIILAQNFVDAGNAFDYKIISQSCPPSTQLALTGSNPFINGMLSAYADHRPIVLSPDMIWLLISQGFSHHVNANAELLRDKLVRHEGKKQLIIKYGYAESVQDMDWELNISKLSELIKLNTTEDLYNLLKADFSTTTPTELIASEITLMNSVQPYFEYIVTYAACGIPSVTLLGTTADWQKVLEKTQALSKYELEWWTDELIPILNEFVNASKGKVKKEFWLNMIKEHSPRHGCGDPIYYDGWFIKFYPYNNKNIRLKLDKLTYPQIRKELPEEIVKADVICIDELSGSKTDVELWAGFIGIEQNEEDFSLSPKIGWMVREKNNNKGDEKRFQKLKDSDGLKLVVDEIPIELNDIDTIRELEIEFVNEVHFPDWMKSKCIGRLEVSGKISDQEKEKLIHWYRSILINGVRYLDGDSIVPKKTNDQSYYDDDYVFPSFEIDGLIFDIGDDEYKVKSISENYLGDGNITIPSTVTFEGIEYSVTEIGEKAFQNCNLVKSIIIEEGVGWIGPNAFSGCTNLEKVIFPKSVKSIDDEVFFGCTSLTDITLSADMYSIGNRAFSKCSSLKSIALPQKIQEIGNRAFYDCSNLDSIFIPMYVNRIFQEAFSGNNSIKSVIVDERNETFDSRNGCNGIIKKSKNSLICGFSITKIPNDITSIESEAFSGCMSLKEIVIPENIKTIESGAFQNCKNLSQITLPNGLKTISAYCFSNCSNLSQINLPDSLSSIYYSAFRGCSNLENISLPEGLSEIDEDAFSSCKKLKSITIPASVKIIYGSICSFCDNLEQITVSKENKYFDSRNNCNAIIETKTNKLISCCSNTIIPNGINIIGRRAFYGCSKLTSLYIPMSVTMIESNTMSYCRNLSKIEVDKENSFYDSRKNCNAIVEKATDILIVGCSTSTIDKSITEIGENAFRGNYLNKKLTIPNNISFIENAAFEGCEMQNIHFHNTLKGINGYAFRGCSFLKKVKIPKNFSKIEEGAFSDCRSLCKLTISRGVEEIESSAFANCPNIESLSLPNGLLYINNNAFLGCYGIKELTLPKTLIEINRSAFSDCYGLKDYRCPEFLGSEYSGKLLIEL